MRALLKIQSLQLDPSILPANLLESAKLHRLLVARVIQVAVARLPPTLSSLLNWTAKAARHHLLGQHFLRLTQNASMQLDLANNLLTCHRQHSTDPKRSRLTFSLVSSPPLRRLSRSIPSLQVLLSLGRKRLRLRLQIPWLRYIPQGVLDTPSDHIRTISLFLPIPSHQITFLERLGEHLAFAKKSRLLGHRLRPRIEILATLLHLHLLEHTDMRILRIQTILLETSNLIVHRMVFYQQIEVRIYRVWKKVSARY